MPPKQSDQHRHAVLRKQSRKTAPQAQQLRSVLTNRKSAIEHVFTATHGRTMTYEERRRLFERIDGEKGHGFIDDYRDLLSNED